jgi:hypothetical protein
LEGKSRSLEKREGGRGIKEDGRKNEEKWEKGR